MSPEERKNFKKICIMPGERNTSRPRPIPTFASFDYDTIMKREFAPFAKLDIPNDDIEQHLQ